MIEIFCVIEEPGEDDFVCLLKKDAQGAWGGLAVEDDAILETAVESAVGGGVAHVWPLCDRVKEEQPPRETGDRREESRRARTHLGALLDGRFELPQGEWAVVGFDDACDMVPESDRRVLTLARQGAWIHKVSQVEV